MKNIEQFVVSLENGDISIFAYAVRGRVLISHFREDEKPPWFHILVILTYHNI